jgi:hypothetical protein
MSALILPHVNPALIMFFNIYGYPIFYYVLGFRVASCFLTPVGVKQAVVIAWYEHCSMTWRHKLNFSPQAPKKTLNGHNPFIELLYSWNYMVCVKPPEAFPVYHRIHQRFNQTPD